MNHLFLTVSSYNVSGSVSDFYIKGKCTGLGNMLFQLASAINYSLKNNALLYAPCLNTYFKLENLEKSKTIFKYINTDIVGGFDNRNIIHLFEQQYLLDVPFYNNIHISGYFENFANFDEIKHIIINYFSPTEDNKQYLYNKYPIIKDENIASIHVRMGPCIKNHYTIERILFIENTYYEMMDFMISYKNINKFMVLTNDKDYCEQIFNKNDKYKHIEFYYSNEEIDFFDIWLISLIKNNILSFSTFSLWGSYLNTNNNRFIIGSDKTVKENLRYKEWVYI
jgi:hypothetical protein